VSGFWSQIWRGLTHSGPGYDPVADRYAEEKQAWSREKLELLAANEEQLRHWNFLRDVLEIFYRADAREYLLWSFEGSGGRLRLWANCSDVFAWGGADSEEITPTMLPLLGVAFADLKAIDRTHWLAELYAARVRGMRPQGAAYPRSDEKHAAQVAALFDACGPEREVGLGNPKPRPEYEGGTDEQYERVIGHLMAGRKDLALEELGTVFQGELDAMFDRATVEQIAREDLREIIIDFTHTIPRA
jgi:hypothetical protein